MAKLKIGTDLMNAIKELVTVNFKQDILNLVKNEKIFDGKSLNEQLTALNDHKDYKYSMMQTVYSGRTTGSFNNYTQYQWIQDKLLSSRGDGFKHVGNKIVAQKDMYILILAKCCYSDTKASEVGFNIKKNGELIPGGQIYTGHYPNQLQDVHMHCFTQVKKDDAIDMYIYWSGNANRTIYGDGHRTSLACIELPSTFMTN